MRHYEVVAEHSPGREPVAMSPADNYRRWILAGLAPYLGKKQRLGGPPIGKNVLLVARRR